MLKFIKAKFIVIIIGLIALFSLFLIANPYHFESRNLDYSSDLVFENESSIKEADITFDYSNPIDIDSSILGTLTAKYIISSEEENKAILPLASTLNNTSCDSAINKNVSITINGVDVTPSPLYGKAISSNYMSYTYDKLYEMEYKAKKYGDHYYFHDYSNSDGLIAINYETVNNASFITYGITKLSYKELVRMKLRGTIPDNIDIKNQIVYQISSNKAFILSKKKLDENCMNDVGKITDVINSINAYKYLFENYTSNPSIVNIDDSTIIAENELEQLFKSSGAHYFNPDEFVMKKRISLYQINIPKGISEIIIKYNNIAGADMRYESTLYEATFRLNKKNYKNVESFKARYILNDTNKYLNFSTIEWNQEDNTYTYQASEAPNEVKIFFSAGVTSVLSVSTLVTEIAGYAKYLIIPALCLILLIALLIKLVSFYNENKMSIPEMLKHMLGFIGNHIPEILTFYLIGFKFFTLYTGDSDISEINVLLTLIFLVLCAIYIMIKTIKKISWPKFIIMAIIAIASAILSFDIVFILLIALALTYIEKGGKPFLKAMYISITFFFVQTLVFEALDVINDPSFYIWIDHGLTGENGALRYSLGFTHPNAVGLFLFVGMLCYLIYERRSLLSRLLLTIICGVFFLFTRSRTSSFCILILIVCDILADYIKFKGKWRYIFVVVFPLFTALSFFVSYKFGQVYNSTFDSMLSHRPNYIYQYLQNSIITLKGQGLNSNYPIDNLYMNVLILEGIPTFCAYLIIYIMATIYIIKYEDNRYLFALIVYLVYSLFEATLMCYALAVFIVLYFIFSLRRKCVNKDLFD